MLRQIKSHRDLLNSQDGNLRNLNVLQFLTERFSCKSSTKYFQLRSQTWLPKTACCVTSSLTFVSLRKIWSMYQNNINKCTAKVADIKIQDYISAPEINTMDNSGKIICTPWRSGPEQKQASVCIKMTKTDFLSEYTAKACRHVSTWNMRSEMAVKPTAVQPTSSFWANETDFWK